MYTGRVITFQTLLVKQTGRKPQNLHNPKLLNDKFGWVEYQIKFYKNRYCY